MSIGACNDAAEKNRKECKSQADVVVEAVAKFFSVTPCGKSPAEVNNNNINKNCNFYIASILP